MRIIGGKYKGRQVKAPEAIRPTQDKVRESVFNIIAPKIEGSAVLELFAGSGAIGIEALSRGASSVDFCDNSIACIKVIEENLNILEEEDRQKAQIYKKDINAAIEMFYKEKRSFDIIFLDPPYHKNTLRKCLKSLSIYDILANSGLVIAEHFKKDEVPHEASPLVLSRQITYGDTTLTIYKKTR